MPKLAEKYQITLNAIVESAGDGSLAVMDCQEKATGKPKVLLIIAVPQPNGSVEIFPVAEMFDPEEDTTSRFMPPDSKSPTGYGDGDVTISVSSREAQCGAQCSERGYLCTLSEGHDGDHQAYGTGPEPIWGWPQAKEG